MRLTLLIAAATLVAAPAIATAQTVVPVDKFDAVELHGGGMITIRQGPVQRVTIVHGDPGVFDEHVPATKLPHRDSGQAIDRVGIRD